MKRMGNIIRNRRRELGISVEDLAKKLGKNRATIYRYESGDIRTLPYDVLEPLADALHTTPGNLLPSTSERKQCLDCIESQAVRIPIYEAVAAGEPIQMNSDTTIFETIPEEWTRNGEYFGVKVKGDSMEPVIHDGDVVVARKQHDADSGDIVIVSLGNETATCKKITKDTNGIMLVPINSMYPPRYFSNEQIQEQQIAVIGRVKVSMTSFF